MMLNTRSGGACIEQIQHDDEELAVGVGGERAKIVDAAWLVRVATNATDDTEDELGTVRYAPDPAEWKGPCHRSASGEVEAATAPALPSS